MLHTSAKIETELVSRCFESSQPQRITAGLIETENLTQPSYRDINILSDLFVDLEDYAHRTHTFSLASILVYCDWVISYTLFVLLTRTRSEKP